MQGWRKTSVAIFATVPFTAIPDIITLPMNGVCNVTTDFDNTKKMGEISVIA